ncbi:MAG: response regulator [Pseudomonadota bacterium]|nr:response regulator [Pseudomonadota bacterium]
MAYGKADTGKGITSKEQARLFSRFTKGEAEELMARHKGAGLGLAICHNLVELMGGQIGVTSQPGAGSCFWFTASFDVARGHPRGIAPPLANKRILLVEDGPILRDGLKAMIESHGGRAIDVTSLKGALDVARRDRGLDAAVVGWSDTPAQGTRFADELKALGVRRVVILCAHVDHTIPHPPIDVCLPLPVQQARLIDAICRNPQVRTHEERTREDTVSVNERFRLLVVDDSITNQMVAATMLKRAGFKVDVAGNGIEAVEAVRTVPYDLVLMDLAMPEMDGIAATKAIRALPGETGDVPVVAMTANVTEGADKRCLEAGMNDYIPKPLERARMLKTLSKWLEMNEINVDTPTDAAEYPNAGPLDTEIIDTMREDVDEEVFGNLLDVFLGEARVRSENIIKALADGNVAKVELEAHALKGSSGSFGARILAASALDIEMACKNDDTNLAARLAARLTAQVDETAEAYEKAGYG